MTLKRTAATLGVVAGLLAAAAPAGAQFTPPIGTDKGSLTANGFGLSFEHIDMNVRTNAGTQIGSEG